METKEQIMPKVRIRDGNLTIPLSDEIREKLDVHDGDELDAHVFKGSVTFTRMTEDARRQAGERIMATIDQVRLRPGQPAMTPEAVDHMVDDEVKAVRRARHARERHD